MISPSRLAFLLISAVAAFVIAPDARAAIPATGAHADASANAPGATGGTASDDDSNMASAIYTASGDDFAEGEAEATVSGPVRSRSTSGGASGTNSPSDADATASWVANLVTAGTDPGGAIDIDVEVSIDGSLSYLNNNSGASADDILAGVSLKLIAYDDVGATPSFDGSAKLATVTNPTPPALTRTGDWLDPSRDGDFTVVGSCTAFSCQYDVSATIAFENQLSVGFGETFAVEVELGTESFAFAGFEIDAGSDFLNTGTVTVSTDTPGVTIEAAPLPMPALGTWPRAAVVVALLGSAAFAAGGPRWRWR